MNARRLAVTEMNMATQAAESTAYANNPLVAGYEIRLSNNHTVKDPRHPGKVNPLHDVCDELQGKYPATFRFTGWHPHCRCTMIPILISAEERRKLAQARAEGKTYQPQGIITDVPANYKAWVAKNQDRIASAKTLPFFLQDNGEMTKDGYVIDLNATTAPEQMVQIKEKYESYDENWTKDYFNDTTGGYNVSHIKHQFSDTKAVGAKLSGGETEKLVARLLADKSGKQIEFLPENGKGKGKPDMAFDGQTWDIKNISMANENTIRKCIEDARKAQCAIFYWDEESRLDSLKSAINRTIGKFNKMGK